MLILFITLLVRADDIANVIAQTGDLQEQADKVKMVGKSPICITQTHDENSWPPNVKDVIVPMSNGDKLKISTTTADDRRRIYHQLKLQSGLKTSSALVCAERSQVAVCRALENGVTMGKVFVTKSGLMSTAIGTDGIAAQWDHHVATFVMGTDGKKWVIDPSALTEGPLLLEDWLAKMPNAGRPVFAGPYPVKQAEAERSDYHHDFYGNHNCEANQARMRKCADRLDCKA